MPRRPVLAGLALAVKAWFDTVARCWWWTFGAGGCRRSSIPH